METSTAVISASISWLWAQASSCWNNITSLLICFLLLALLLDYVIYRKRSSRFPPGPTPLPFVGNLLKFDFKNPEVTVQHWTKKYGIAILIHAAWQKYVILSGFKVIKEAFGQKAEDFADRPDLPLLNTAGYTKNCGGIFMATHSDGWKEQRRFCVSTLRTFGMGKRTLEWKISEEAGYLCSEFKSQEGSPFNPRELLNNAVGNIICILTFGDRFDYNDVTFLQLIHLTEEFMRTTTRYLPQLLVQRSWLSFVPGPHQRIKKHFNSISVIIKQIVNEHKKTRDPTLPRDLIDAFLEEIEKVKENPESSFNEQNLIKVIFDLFGAGTETTSSTLLWGILEMVLHPEVQERVHEEIEEVLGRDKPPTMADQPNMPYTNAVIHELQRWADIIPFPFPYSLHQDVQIDKFVIPKGTTVFSYLSSVLKDDTMWEKPHQFYPEHFLDASGQFVKREAFLPFNAASPHYTHTL
uniref:Uncharacterized protein n=1 Tax=Sphaerodactylus townsendi TaxID=933632 RepID=A0ACB8FP23_9SAUR